MLTHSARLVRQEVGTRCVCLFVCCLAAAVGLAARREGLDELGRCGKAMTGGVNEEDASALEGADRVVRANVVFVCSKWSRFWLPATIDTLAEWLRRSTRNRLG